MNTTPTNTNLRYLEASLHSASAEELIVKTFDALVLFARQAHERMVARPGDVQGRHDLLRRAQRAVALLMGSLDFEVGGDLARNLFRIYEYWHHELVLANMHADAERVERLLPDFQAYRETWAEAVKRFRVEKVGAENAQFAATSA